MYILDTNTLIYFFKGMGNVGEKIFQTSPKDIAIPTIVLFELRVGILKSSRPKKRIKQLQEMTSLVNVIPLGGQEANHAAVIRASLEQKGNVIGPYDILIAGTALAHQAILITRNVAEFKRIKNLKLENWY